MKRLLSFILAMTMIFTDVNIPVRAEENESITDVIEVETELTEETENNMEEVSVSEMVEMESESETVELPDSGIESERTYVTEEDKVVYETGDVISSGTCGSNLTWVLTEKEKDNYTLTVSGSGEMNDYYSGNAPWYTYKNKIKTVVVEEGITSIGYETFRGCSNLTSIELPEGITSIGTSAFYDCSNLTSIELPEGITSIGTYAFSGCSSLTSIELPEGITSIGDGTFRYCSSLTSIELPEGITSIRYQTFSGCSSLTSIELPEGITSIGSSAFYGCSSLTSIELPEGITSIGSSAFYGCSSLTSIELPEGITSIGSDTFSGCSSLLSIELPEGITSIGSDAFRGCSSLLSIELPKGLTSIGSYAFYGCSNLTSIELPEGLTSIGESAFEDCSNLTSIELPEGLTSIGVSAFRKCSSLLSIELPKGLTSIGSYAFYGCSSLTSIELPKGLTSIDSYAFYRCSSLTSIELPEGLTSIGSYAFDVCSSLTSIELPEGLTSIGSYAFDGCRSLMGIELPESVTSIGHYAFERYIFIKGFVGSAAHTYAMDYGNVFIDTTSSEVDSGMCGDNLTWLLTMNDKDDFAFTLTISGKGEMYNYSNDDYISDDDSPWYAYRSGIVEIKISDEITSIGSYAFSGCSNLTEIVIPSSVTYIGLGAFSNCTNLKEVSLPDGIKRIENQTFEGCSSLAAIDIPSSVRSIGDSAFYNCSALDKITISANVSSMGSTVFGMCGFTSAGPIGGGYDIEYGWTEIIPDYAFSGCSSLTEIVIPNSVTSIGSYAFKDCSSLNKIEIPNGVTSIGYYAFRGCSNLKNIEIPSSATSVYGALCDTGFKTAGPIGGGYDIEYGWTESIPYGAFYGCGNLSELIIADGIKSIDSYALDYCYRLEKLIIPKSVTQIGTINSNNFYYLTIYGYEGSYAQIYAEEINVPFVAIDNLLCTLTLDVNGGEGESLKRDVFKGEACGQLPIPKRTGYTFNGWYTARTGGEKITTSTVFTKNTTLYAQWSINTYTITLDANGGSFEGEHRRDIVFGQKYGELPVPTRTAATFNGWYTALEDGELITADSSVLIGENHTLYARWHKEEIRVTFDANGGRAPEDIVVYHGDPYGELPDAVLAGATFLGWYTALEGGVQVTEETIVDFTELKTLYARWGLKYTVDEPTADITGEEPVLAGTRIKLNVAVNGASIYYTVDGTEPSKENGILYEDAIEVTKAFTLKCYAVKAGYIDSPIVTYSYQVVDESQDWDDILEADRAAFATAYDVPQELWIAGVEESTPYTGNAVTCPDLRVYSHKTLLTEKVDYTVKYANNKKAGTATVTITGKGNYAGSIVKTFEIKALDIKDAVVADVTLSYTGKNQKLATKVTYILSEKEITLKAGTDFTYEVTSLKEIHMYR